MSSPATARDQLAIQLTRENRLRLARTLSLVLFALGSIYVVAFNVLLVFVPATHIPLFFVVDVIIILAVSGWAVTIPLARGSRGNLVAAIIVASLGLGVSALLVSFTAIPALQPLLLSGIGAYMMIIVLAGILGSPLVIVLTTVLTNVLALAFLMYEARTGGVGFATQFWLLVPQTLIQQWAVAAFTIVIGQIYQRTLGQLSASLRAIDQARRLDDLKNQFISSVNHELRTPVMALQGLVETMLVGLHRNMDMTLIEELAQRANRVGDGLRQLILSILEIRQIDQEMQNLAPATIPLIDAIKEAAVLLSTESATPLHRELRLKIPSHLTLWADPIRFRQIVVNLLSNAVKYSDEGTPLEISAIAVTPRAKGREMVEVRFRDWGFGIPPEDIPVLFNRFVRLPRDLASNVNGTGLGLFLCRELAQAMEGSITVESTGIPGEGSIFILRLPHGEVIP